MAPRPSYLRQNQAAWNWMADNGSGFAKVASDEECRHPLATLDSRGWLPASVKGWDVLCLASGGGWQSILYASAGANVTVVDLSSSMLRQDEREAVRRNLKVKTLETSMDNLSMLRGESFDLVHQPVSTCYVADVAAVYTEIARVLRDGGLYISQHKQPTNLQVTRRNRQDEYVIGLEYYQNQSLPTPNDHSYREPGAVEYLHRWEQLVGDLCRSGFVLEDLREPCRADPKAAPGHFHHRGRFVAPYVRLKARRVARPRQTTTPSAIWTP